MSVESERRFHVICNGCGEDFHDPDSTTAMAARISAGVKGWRYLERRYGARGAPLKKATYDFCPACEPKIPEPEAATTP